jgi:hypothetical protein
MTTPDAETFTVGVISDTHGPIDREVRESLAGCGHIVHAGDVVSPQVISALEAIAPLTAVRGNTDTNGPTAALPECATVELAGTRIHVLHEIGRLALDPVAAGVGVVVHGHTHRPSVEREDGVLYLNPGSAGCPRGGAFPSVVRLRLGGGRSEVEVVRLAGRECSPAAERHDA